MQLAPLDAPRPPFSCPRPSAGSDSLSLSPIPPLKQRRTAPEARLGLEQYDAKCDVYSYAVFLLELADFRRVHEVYARDALFVATMQAGARPDLAWVRETNIA